MPSSSPCSRHRKPSAGWGWASRCFLPPWSGSWTLCRVPSAAETDAPGSRAPPWRAAGPSGHHGLVWNKDSQYLWSVNGGQVLFFREWLRVHKESSLTSVRSPPAGCAGRGSCTSSAGCPVACCPCTARSEWGAQTCYWTPAAYL